MMREKTLSNLSKKSITGHHDCDHDHFMHDAKRDSYDQSRGCRKESKIC